MSKLIAVEEYLNQFHPGVYQEVLDRLKSIPCNNKLTEEVFKKASDYRKEKWQVQLITIASVLALCSPETLYVGSRVKLGVGKSLSYALGVSQQRVSQKFISASHYYRNVNWCRECVDNIVKEVRCGR